MEAHEGVMPTSIIWSGHAVASDCTQPVAFVTRLHCPAVSGACRCWDDSLQRMGRQEWHGCEVTETDGSFLQDLSGGAPVPIEGTELPLWAMEIDTEKATADFRASSKAGKGKVQPVL